MGQLKLFLEKITPPVDKFLPKTVNEMIDCVVQFVKIGDTSSAQGFTNVVISKDAPEDTDVLWIQVDANGFPLGQFKFNDGEWLSVTYTKGVTIQPYVGPAIIEHPHWRICDPDVVGAATVNGVTIPNMRDRMLVMASPQELAKYVMNEIGGGDVLNLSVSQLPNHVHAVGNFSITVASNGDHQHEFNQNLYSDPLSGESGGDSFPTGRLTPGQLKTAVAGAHIHTATLNGQSAGTGNGDDIDLRSLFYAVGFAIYVGIGDPLAC